LWERRLDRLGEVLGEDSRNDLNEKRGATL